MNPDAALEQLMIKAQRIDQQVALLRGSGTAADGRIRIEVDAAGDIIGTYVSDELRGVAPSELARLIADAQRSAVASARLEAKELRSELTDDPYVAGIANAAVAEATPRRAQQAEVADDDDYQQPKSWLS